MALYSMCWHDCRFVVKLCLLDFPFADVDTVRISVKISVNSFTSFRDSFSVLLRLPTQHYSMLTTFGSIVTV